jgi:hypothetical protein
MKHSVVTSDGYDASTDCVPVLVVHFTAILPRVLREDVGQA